MRWILGILVLLLILGTHACRVDVRTVRQSPASHQEWIRTVDGWERRGTWLPLTPRYQPALHPLVLGFGQALLAVGALVAFSPRPPLAVPRPGLHH